MNEQEREQVIHDLGIIVARAFHAPGDTAQGVRQALDQLGARATASDLILLSLARAGGATTEEVEAAAKAAVLLRRP